ncbi:MAG: signal recognition particle protein [Deltaproteobacteria bacterium]
MFESLAEKFEPIFKKLKGNARLNEENIDEALRDVRIALLEADVNFNVVKSFIDNVKSQAIGEAVLQSITPGQQVIKIVHGSLINLLGASSSYIRFGSRLPAPIMLVGLQGCGKTTTAVKLAKHLIASGRRTFLVSADIYRPAAIQQLKILAEQIKTEAYDTNIAETPVDICVNAINEAKRKGYEAIIIDTAGRLQIDQPMMQEIKDIATAVKPAEILFVADAMTGQEAVNIAKAFNEVLPIDGVILTKMDSDARGGAALSLMSVLGKPIKFIGVGEKSDAIEPFHPERMASRILGMGDIVSLVEKAKSVTNINEARVMEEKLRKNDFSLDDFRSQIQQINKMGSLRDMLGMIPGMGKMAQTQNANLDEKELIKVVAMIDSMTPRERQYANIIDGSRRKRIAKGSGTTVQDINRLLKSYEDMKKMMKMFSKKGAMAKLKRTKFPFQ